MDIEELVRSTTPDFMDLDINTYIEEDENGNNKTIVQVRGDHDGSTYGFEMSAHDEDIPDEIKVSELNRFYQNMIETVIDDEL